MENMRGTRAMLEFHQLFSVRYYRKGWHRYLWGMRSEPAAVIHHRPSSSTFLWQVRMATLSSSRQDVLQLHPVRACTRTTTGKRYLSPWASCPGSSWGALRAEKSALHKKRSIHRLAHTDLIRTAREDRRAHTAAERREWHGGGE